MQDDRVGLLLLGTRLFTCKYMLGQIRPTLALVLAECRRLIVITPVHVCLRCIISRPDEDYCCCLLAPESRRVVVRCEYDIVRGNRPSQSTATQQASLTSVTMAHT